MTNKLSLTMITYKKVALKFPHSVSKATGNGTILTVNSKEIGVFSINISKIFGLDQK